MDSSSVKIAGESKFYVVSLMIVVLLKCVIFGSFIQPTSFPLSVKLVVDLSEVFQQRCGALCEIRESQVTCVELVRLAQ